MPVRVRVGPLAGRKQTSGRAELEVCAELLESSESGDLAIGTDYACLVSGLGDRARTMRSVNRDLWDRELRN